MQLYVPLSMPGLPGIKEIKKKREEGTHLCRVLSQDPVSLWGGEEMVRPLVSLKVAQAAWELPAVCDTK